MGSLSNIKAEFWGTSRFEILRRLGAGGCGVVYEVYDRERALRVALKTMEELSADRLLRFKNEFRQLQDLDHENLVRLGELIEEDGHWFFTMELIVGSNLIHYVSDAAQAIAEAATATLTSIPPPGMAPSSLPPADLWAGAAGAGIRQRGEARYSEHRLRACLAQLAEGLAFLHRNGKVHRDIKPSNILVTDAGRVVLLDFGLVAQMGEASLSSTAVTSVVGTPAYMAPEAVQGTVGPEADWYGVGVILFQALTGRLPFEGSEQEILLQKRVREAPHPSHFSDDVPEDLDNLCFDLLAREPHQRPTAAEVLERAAGSAITRTYDETPAVVPNAIVPRDAWAPLLGRAPELEQLWDALEHTRRGHAVAVTLQGESGIGKSSLLRRFCEEATSRRGALVLTGRCYEKESVPYKAVDGLVDALSGHLATLSPVDAASVLPQGIGLLASMFPVLKRVQAITQVPKSLAVSVDPQELRTRVFGALRELLSRIAAGTPLVLAIDDLQWTDRDSLSLLAHVLQPPDAPPILLVASLRTDARGQLVTVPEVVRSLPGDVRHLTVGPLPEPVAVALVADILGRGDAEGADAEQVYAIVKEASGHPLFALELARHARERAADSRPGESGEQQLSLDDAVWSRAERLPEDARRVLETVCAAHAPLMAQTLERACDLRGTAWAEAIAILRGSGFVRVSGMRAQDTVEPYHDRVRESVLARLDSTRRRGLHEAIARSLETASASPDPEAHALHWFEAGRPELALAHGRVAAKQAQAALAFDSAARLYRFCLELASSHAEARELRIKLAEVLAHGGRGAEAAQAYLAARKGDDSSEDLDLRRRAGEQLLISGRPEEGMAVYGDVLAHLGVPEPKTPSGWLGGLLLRRVQVRALGLRPKPATDPAEITRDIARMDACWPAALGWSLIQPVRGTYFQTLNLIYALKVGEPHRLARALVMEAAFQCASGTAGKRLKEVLARVEEIATEMNHPYAHGWAKLADGVSYFLRGLWPEASHRLAQCEHVWLERPVQLVEEGVVYSYVTNAANIFLFTSLLWRGRVRENAERLAPLLRDAEARDDRYLMTHLKIGVQTNRYLAAGDAAGGRKAVDEVMMYWPAEGTYLPHLLGLQSRTLIDIYEGRAVEAYERMNQRWPAIARSLHFRVTYLRILLHDLRGRCALAAAVDPSAPAKLRDRALADAARCARKLGSEKMLWPTVLSLLLKGAVAEAREEYGSAASLFAKAATAASQNDMQFHRAVADVRGERLSGPADLVSRIDAATKVFRDEGVADPARYMQMILAG